MRLAADAPGTALLHGDLTPANILDGGEQRGLVAIDPAPCVGDPAFDAIDLVLWRADDAETITARLEQLAPTWLSTSPESGFVRVPMAERRDATGVDVIRGVVLARIGANAFIGEPITDRSEWFDVLAHIFDLRFDAAPPEWRERLWNAVLHAHRAWEASQG